MKTMRNLFLAFTAAVILASCQGGNSKRDEERKALVEQKCTACHFTDRIFDAKKTKAEWKKLVQRMRAMNPNLISEQEAVVIWEYFKEKRVDEKTEARALADEKCSTACHVRDRIYDARSKEEWEKLVWKMRELDESVISKSEANILIEYFQKYMTDTETIIKDLVEYNCTKCHVGNRIGEKKHTKKEWEDIVTRMRGKNPDITTEGEAMMLIDYLQKTASSD